MPKQYPAKDGAGFQIKMEHACHSLVRFLLSTGTQKLVQPRKGLRREHFRFKLQSGRQGSGFQYFLRESQGTPGLHALQNSGAGFPGLGQWGRRTPFGIC